MAARVDAVRLGDVLPFAPAVAQCGEDLRHSLAADGADVSTTARVDAVGLGNVLPFAPAVAQRRDGLRHSFAADGADVGMAARVDAVGLGDVLPLTPAVIQRGELLRHSFAADLAGLRAAALRGAARLNGDLPVAPVVLEMRLGVSRFRCKRRDRNQADHKDEHQEHCDRTLYKMFHLSSSCLGDFPLSETCSAEQRSKQMACRSKQTAFHKSKINITLQLYIVI